MKSNKRAELITIFFLLVSLAIIIFYYGEYISTKNYIGDSISLVAYNIKSNNPNCDLYSIDINNQNIKFFETRQEVLDANYNISRLCP